MIFNYEERKKLVASLNNDNDIIKNVAISNFSWQVGGSFAASFGPGITSSSNENPCEDECSN